MEFKGTPNWRITRKETETDFGVVSIGNDFQITGHSFLVPDFIDDNVEEINANLRLIAAAPELLEALEFTLCKIYENGLEKQLPASIEKIRAAINKALHP